MSNMYEKRAHLEQFCSGLDCIFLYFSQSIYKVHKHTHTF
jgi:hypothetical protein